MKFRYDVLRIEGILENVLPTYLGKDLNTYREFYTHFESDILKMKINVVVQFEDREIPLEIHPKRLFKLNITEFDEFLRIQVEKVIHERHLYRIIGYDIVSYPLIKELPSSFYILINGEKKQYPKRKTRDTEYFLEEKQAIKALNKKIDVAIEYSGRTMTSAIREVENTHNSFVFRLRYKPNEVVTVEKFFVQQKTQKGWECQVSEPDSKGKIKTQNFYPSKNSGSHETTPCFAKWVFHKNKAESVLMELAIFVKQRQRHLKALKKDYYED